MWKPVSDLCYLLPGTGTSSTPATPWRGPSGRSSCGSRAMSWLTGQTKATGAASTQPEPQAALGCPQHPPRTNYLCPQELEPTLCSAHLSQTTSLFTLGFSPEQLSQLYVPFGILNQQEIGPNPFHTKMPDHLWGGGSPKVV